MAGILFLISAPSGSGKSSLVNQLRSQVENLEFSVSYTTRPPRGSEEEAREYHFISREEFQRMIEADEFLEYADVFGNYYGTARSSLTHASASARLSNCSTVGGTPSIGRPTCTEKPDFSPGLMMLTLATRPSYHAARSAASIRAEGEG